MLQKSSTTTLVIKIVLDGIQFKLFIMLFCGSPKYNLVKKFLEALKFQEA